jgi:hypothetical protein
MSIHQIERAAVLMLGFVAGALLAMCIAPGDIFLWVATGIVLGLFCRAFFVNSFGEAWLWPFAHSRHSHKGGTDEDRP